MRILPTIIGIDLGPSAIKVVEYDRRYRLLKAFGLAPLPDGALADGEIRDEDTVAECIIALLEKLKINPAGRAAAIALAGPSVEIRRILASPEDLGAVLPLKAEQHFKQDINALYYECLPLNGPTEEGRERPYLLVGCARDLVDQHVSLIARCGLRAAVVDTQALAMANAFMRQSPINNYISALLDVGQSTTRLVLIGGEQVLMAQEISVGGRDFTKTIQSQIDFDVANAEALKINLIADPSLASENVHLALAQTARDVAEQIASVIDDFFRVTRPIPGLQGLKMILTAGGASPSIEHALIERLELPVQRFRPFPAASEVDPAYFAEFGHVYAVAAGLGLRDTKDEVQVA